MMRRRMELLEKQMKTLSELVESQAATTIDNPSSNKEPGTVTAEKEEEPAWLRTAKNDYDATGTVGATCVLTSNRAPWGAKLLAALIVLAQFGMLWVLYFRWIPQHKDAFFGGNRHSHTAPVPLSMLNATGYSDVANYREICWDFPQGWKGKSAQGGRFDGDGWTCANYKANSYCTTSGGYGSGWAPWSRGDWGTFADNADVNGVDAAQACCACGGGRQVNVVDTEMTWSEEARVESHEGTFADRFGYFFFGGVVLVFAFFAGTNNVGTVDPYGWFSMYSRISKWKAAATFLYTFVMCAGTYVVTYQLLTASAGVDLVLNALAIMFLVDLDEQLLAALLPLRTRAAVAQEFRDARRAPDWRKWKAPGCAWLQKCF